MMKLTENFSFKNWAGNVKTSAKYFAQPENENEIIGLVKSHAKVRVVGTGHSWSDHFSTDGLLMNLDKYNRVIAIDKQLKTIKVQAGIKLWELNVLLDKEGLALINLGSIDKQSLAGAISTGTHGTGINFQCLASQVLEFSLIKADGTIQVFKRGHDDFNGAIVNLGALGVVSEMTLQVTDAFNLHDKTYTIDFEELIDKIDELIYGNDHFKIWWLPPAKKAVVYTYKRTQEPVNDSRLRQIFKDEIISVVGYRTLVKIGNLRPAWRRPINTFLTQQFDKPLDRIEKSFKVFNVPEPPKHRETEWAFDVARAKEILTDYKKLLTDTEHTFNFIQEIRFTKGDDFWLSECHGRDTIWIGAYNHLDKQWSGILKEFETFALARNGRPHWGKEFTIDSHQVELMYPKYGAFVEMRKALDPTGKFENELMGRLF